MLGWVLAVALAACTAKPAPVPDAGGERDCRPEALVTLSDIMACRMKPFQAGKVSEEELRQALARVREAVPDLAWMSGDNAWPQIVDRMLLDHEYRNGCNQCHRAYLKPYQERFKNQRIP